MVSRIHGDAALSSVFVVVSLLAILSIGTEIAATLSAIASMLRDIRLEVRAVPAATGARAASVTATHETGAEAHA